MINDDATSSPPVQQELEDKCVLAKAVPEAVFSIAANGFVHKSSQCSTDIIIQPPNVSLLRTATNVGEIVVVRSHKQALGTCERR